jgi:hypothetical protein
MACPVCGSDAEVSAVRRTPDGREGHQVPCARCGPFFVSEEARQDLNGWHRGDTDLIARIAYGIRRMQRDRRPPFVTNELVERFVKTSLPSVFDQAYNLVRLLAGAQSGPGEAVNFDANRDLFSIGAKSADGFLYVISQAEQLRFIETTHADGPQVRARLTFNGWDQYEKLQRGRVESRKAFMAMRYGDAALDEIVDRYFRPAVGQTGFALIRLDDQPRAGLIDDRLRVEIRASRFLVADLSHDNLGAYWEAGYAEGLGKPVIYTCEREKFEHAKTHFDTNHHLTVVWDAGDPAPAAAALKNTIRATLPDEAKLTDD